MTESKNIPEDPLDDDLLRELGLDPLEVEEKASPKAAAPAKPRPAAAAPQKPQAATSKSADDFSDGMKRLSQNMPVQLVAVMGKKTLTLKDMMAFKQGQLVAFGKLPSEPLDLVANGKLVAKGDLVLIDGKVGVQIRQVLV